MKRMRLLTLFVPLLVLAASVIYVVPGHSYLAETTIVNGQPTGDHWPAASLPINWQINNTISGANIAGTPTTVQAAVIASFNTWAGAPNTALSVNAPTVNTSITNANNIPPGVNFVCFVCSGVNFSTDGTLAITSTFSNGGQITQSFILFNPNAMTGGQPSQPICFTVAGDTNCPTSGSVFQDLQTVATHEIGHFFGLDHSGVVRAVMYPNAPDLETNLSFDDVAGISSLYPKASPDVATGSISGTITLAGGGGVFGAHVFANSTTTANPFGAFPIRKSPIGTLTKPGGSYNILGVPADSYVVIAEPLDGPVSTSDVDWGTTFGQTIQTGFTSRWH